MKASSDRKAQHIHRLKHFLYPKSRRLYPRELVRVYETLLNAHGHQKWWPGETPFEIIVGAILTQNTAWTNVEKAITNLKRERLLTPEKIRGLRMAKLAMLIRPAGYFNVKAVRLKNFMEFLDREYQGSLVRMFKADTFKLRKKLLGVTGIGPETADSILLYAAGKLSFVIDAYTKRIFSRHRLHSENADYHEWQSIFTKALPKSRNVYNDFHAQIVHIGKHYCRAKPQCEVCPLKKFLL